MFMYIFYIQKYIDFQLIYDLACNAMETLLIHEDLMNGSFFADVCNLFKREGVKLNSGPKLNQLLTFGPPVAKSMRQEYGALEATIEVVKGLDEAIDHIHKYGSSHTDVICTENGKINCSSKSIYTFRSFMLRWNVPFLTRVYDCTKYVKYAWNVENILYMLPLI